jgi:nucleotide-binding universal stress UspA family protein
LREAGIDVATIASEDRHPADGLLAVASANKADVIVLGTRGAGGFDGLRLGGFALRVLHRARLPLVLVPPKGG